MPRPEVTQLSAPFWQACAEHRLIIQRCNGCGRHRMNPAPVCHACRSFHWTWQQSEGLGEVYTYTVVHHPVHPAMQASVPYVAAVIQLDDCGGVRLTSNVIECDPAAVEVGMRVEIVWEDLGEGCSLYRFRPLAQSME